MGRPRQENSGHRHYEAHLERMKRQYLRNAETIKAKRLNRYYGQRFDSRVERWLNEWSYTFPEKEYTRKQ